MQTNESEENQLPALPGTVTAAAKPKTLKDMLVSYKNQMAAALPKHLNADRMLRIVMTEISKNPKLKECTPASFIGSVLTCCQVGLEPGPLGKAFLIPYKNSRLSKESGNDVYECQFQIGYKGLVELARRSGDIRRISAHEVCENDKFEYCFGLVEKCHHVMAEGDRGAYKGAFVVVEFKDGSYQFDYMPVAEINKARDRSSSYSNWVRFGKKGDLPIWETDYGEQAKKTVFKRLSKYLPLSIEVQEAIAMDDEADYGTQRASLIIDGEIEKKAPKKSKSEEVAERLVA